MVKILIDATREIQQDKQIELDIPIKAIKKFKKDKGYPSFYKWHEQEVLNAYVEDEVDIDDAEGDVWSYDTSSHQGGGDWETTVQLYDELDKNKGE